MSVAPTETEFRALLDYAEWTFGEWSGGTWAPGEPRPPQPGSHTIPHDLAVDDPCPRCGGSRKCPQGCEPLPDAEPDWIGGKRPVRTHKSVRAESEADENDWHYEVVADQGEDCDYCTVYGDCMNCRPGGIGLRPFRRSSSAMELWRCPLYPCEDYSRPGVETVRMSLDRAAALLAEREREPSLF